MFKGKQEEQPTYTFADNQHYQNFISNTSFFSEHYEKNDNTFTIKPLDRNFFEVLQTPKTFILLMYKRIHDHVGCHKEIARGGEIDLSVLHDVIASWKVEKKSSEYVNPLVWCQQFHRQYLPDSHSAVAQTSPNAV